MIDEPETMLLRVRTETLRVNLRRAHANLKNLPDLVKQLDDVQQRMDKLRGDTWEVGEILDRLRRDAGRANLPHYAAMFEASKKFERVGVASNNVHDSLKSLREKSFLVAVGEVGSTIGDCLDRRAEELEQRVAQLEQTPPGPDAWRTLTDIEAAARNQVFDEGVELLGGIALRDVRLGSDICELAEALIGSISARGQNLNVIPGGISAMMMTVEQIVRLRFPEWTVWALPFVISEVWPLAQRKDLEAFTRLPAVQKLSADPIMQRCFGDAFATYTLGPAYAFAALSLSFDPASAEDELRAHATLTMLHLLDRSAPDAFHESYHTIADELLSAWNTARQQAGGNRETPALAANALLDLVKQLTVRLDAAEAAELQARTERVTGLVVVKRDLPAAAEVEKIVQALFGVLRQRVYYPFEPSEWGTVKSWAEKLAAGQGDQIEVEPHHTMRHALNAAWLARVSVRQNISNAAHKLVNRLRAGASPAPTQASGGPPGSPI